jgi:glycosyltransferase involved in cell wall biosynthesis
VPNAPSPREKPLTGGTGTRFGLLLGADGITGRRSGIGRQILEVARRLRDEPAVADMALLIGARAEPPALLNRLGQESDDDRPSGGGDRAGGARALLAGVPGLAALRGKLVGSRLDRTARAMEARNGVPALYHEINTIARPFRGVTVVTVHDLSFRADPQLHPPARVAWIERRLPATLRQARRFVAVSAFTRREMIDRLALPADRIDVVEPGLSADFRPVGQPAAAAVLARFGLADRSYVLAVSTLEPRKNFDRLLEAHVALPAALRARFPLVIAGGRGWGSVLPDSATARHVADGTLRLPGFVSDAELVPLYSRAAVCAYPSLYEGFGLPVLEAMACGTPVVTANGSALADTAGGAALAVDPRDPAAIAEALRRVLEDDALAGMLRARGLAHAAGFTWARMARGLVRSWQHALADGVP